jgi:hypothetical protein
MHSINVDIQDGRQQMNEAEYDSRTSNSAQIAQIALASDKKGTMKH